MKEKPSKQCPDCRGRGIRDGKFCDGCHRKGTVLLFDDECPVCFGQGAFEDPDEGFIFCPTNCEAARLLVVLVSIEEDAELEFAELQVEATIRCRALTELSPELAYVDQVHFDPFSLLH
jgi:predicted DCC family thiol-disulfide oxidoreductase YuxK